LGLRLIDKGGLDAEISRQLEIAVELAKPAPEGAFLGRLLQVVRIDMGVIDVEVRRDVPTIW